jgi:hypothetical protein
MSAETTTGHHEAPQAALAAVTIERKPKYFLGRYTPGPETEP